MADYNSKAYFLRADLKFGFWTGDTAPTEWYGPVNFTKLEITNATQNSTKLISNMLSTHGNLIDSQATTTDPAKVSCEFDTMPQNLFAVMTGAVQSSLTQTTTAKADQAIAPTVLNVWYPFPNGDRFIAPDGTGTEIVFETVTPTTIANTNYELDLINGMYKPLTSAALTAVTVSYHLAARTAEVFDAGTSLTKNIQFKGTALEMASKRYGVVTLHKAFVMPSGAIDIVSNGYLKGMLEGDLLVPSAHTGSWRFEYLDQAA